MQWKTHSIRNALNKARIPAKRRTGMKASFDSAQDRLLEVSGNESACKGVDFIVKSKSGNYHEISLQTLNLETTERSIKIPKSEWSYKLPENLWVALVLFMKDIEPAIYLIPAKVWETPDRIFIDNDQGERLKHMSNWEIKIPACRADRFTRGIQELSKYGFGSMVKEL